MVFAPHVTCLQTKRQIFPFSSNLFVFLKKNLAGFKEVFEFWKTQASEMQDRSNLQMLIQLDMFYIPSLVG